MDRHKQILWLLMIVAVVGLAVPAAYAEELKALRVCADPDNLALLQSTDGGWIENRIPQHMPRN